MEICKLPIYLINISLMGFFAVRLAHANSYANIVFTVWAVVNIFGLAFWGYYYYQQELEKTNRAVSWLVGVNVFLGLLLLVSVLAF